MKDNFTIKQRCLHSETLRKTNDEMKDNEKLNTRHFSFKHTAPNDDILSLSVVEYIPTRKRESSKVMRCSVLPTFMVYFVYS